MPRPRARPTKLARVNAARSAAWAGDLTARQAELIAFLPASAEDEVKVEFAKWFLSFAMCWVPPPIQQLTAGEKKARLKELSGACGALLELINDPWVNDQLSTSYISIGNPILPLPQLRETLENLGWSALERAKADHSDDSSADLKWWLGRQIYEFWLVHFKSKPSAYVNPRTGKGSPFVGTLRWCIGYALGAESAPSVDGARLLTQKLAAHREKPRPKMFPDSP